MYGKWELREVYRHGRALAKEGIFPLFFLSFRLEQGRFEEGIRVSLWVAVSRHHGCQLAFNHEEEGLTRHDLQKTHLS